MTGRAVKAIERQKTGCQGLDEVLEGGLPKGSITLVNGAPGSGKTILSLQWLFQGVKEDQNGVYFSVTEPLYNVVTQLETMTFYDKKAIEEERLKLVDLRDLYIKRASPEKFKAAIEKAVKDSNAKRIVIDSITPLLYSLKDKTEIRKMIMSLAKGKIVSNLGCTTILTSEHSAKGNHPLDGVEEFVADGIINLTTISGEQQTIRKLIVTKMRSIEFRSGVITYDITKNGILVFPKIPFDRSIATTEFSERLTTGLPELDKMCGGGIPKGHAILVSGNTGTGKTMFSLQYLIEGLRKKEPCLFIVFDESPKQIKKTAAYHGWDLEEYEKKGLLHFIAPDIIDIYPDKVLYQVLNAINKTQVKRVVLDSISSLQGATQDKNKVREFLIQLGIMLKTKGVTALFTYLSEETFSASSNQLIGSGAASEMRFSSSVDGIILLRYLERRQQVKRLINVLKMRGSQHDKTIREYEVKKGGLVIDGPFKG